MGQIKKLKQLDALEQLLKTYFIGASDTGVGVLGKITADDVANLTIKPVTSTSNLATLSNTEIHLVLVKDVGFFAPLQTESSPDDEDTFASADSGWLWERILKPGDGAGEAESWGALTFDTTTSWNLATGRKKLLDLSDNTTIALSGTTGIEWGVLKLVQDSSGGRTVTFPGKVPLGFEINADPGGETIVGFINVNGTIYWSGETYEGEEVLEELENKTFESFGDWTAASSSITSENGAVNKMKFNTASGYSGTYKAGIYTDGDVLRVTVNATITSGQCFMTFGDVNFNQVVTEILNGINTYDIINTAPGSGNTLMIGAGGPQPVGIGYIRSIKIEKYP